jgi:arylsulfatase A-like enzyme
MAFGYSAAAAQAPPNVVFVLTDDQGYGDLACHGNTVIKTPNMDALHARSVRFTNFHVSPTCAPTRSALMTGRYTNAVGAWHTIGGRSLLAHGEVTMADCFRGSGYRTGIFGKWHLGDNYPCRPQDRGFDEVFVCGGGGVWQTPDYFGNDYMDGSYFRNGHPEAAKGFCTDVWFENATKFIGDTHRSGKRFFCYLATNAPHGPMWAPDSYTDAYAGVKNLKEPGFYGMITNIDDNLGRMVKFLRESNLEKDTLFIFMTDNGTSSGAQVFNAGMRGAKGSPYEGGHRVPFFAYWPGGGIQGGRDIGALSSHIDVLPTLMELCGLKRNSTRPLHGKSLLPLIREKNPQWPERPITVDSQRVENIVKWRQAAVMTSQWRLVNPSPDGKLEALELYDIVKDPGQKENIAAKNPKIVETLSQDYDTWWKLVSQMDNKYVRIVLGNDRDNPSRLTCHDWHGKGAADATWNQKLIRQGPAAIGFWAVDVERAGTYRIELRRWPREVDLPLNAPYRDKKPNREKTPGKAVSVVKAKLSIAGVEQSKPVASEDKAATFTVQLPRGPAELHTWLYGQDGTERGAYFVYVERIKG